MSTATIRPALTAGQIAEALSMNPTSVYRLFVRKDHPLPHVRTGDNAIRVRADTFDQWLREEEQLSVGQVAKRRRK
ncbi:hypothetical protein ACFYVR_15800 [Rhodococcus sp. NPDC003318]|uniref:hypothetical protein n=1 Tax=Rhodococcus sp. NPDC003318 TaxID=3364503 RepID=UPI0036CD664E